MYNRVFLSEGVSDNLTQPPVVSRVHGRRADAHRGDSAEEFVRSAIHLNAKPTSPPRLDAQLAKVSRTAVETSLCRRTIKHAGVCAAIWVLTRQTVHSDCCSSTALPQGSITAERVPAMPSFTCMHIIPGFPVAARQWDRDLA